MPEKKPIGYRIVVSKGCEGTGYLDVSPAQIEKWVSTFAMDSPNRTIVCVPYFEAEEATPTNPNPTAPESIPCMPVRTIPALRATLWVRADFQCACVQDSEQNPWAEDEEEIIRAVVECHQKE